MIRTTQANATPIAQYRRLWLWTRWPDWLDAVGSTITVLEEGEGTWKDCDGGDLLDCGEGTEEAGDLLDSCKVTEEADDLLDCGEVTEEVDLPDCGEVTEEGDWLDWGESAEEDCIFFQAMYGNDST